MGNLHTGEEIESKGAECCLAAGDANDFNRNVKINDATISGDSNVPLSRCEDLGCGRAKNEIPAGKADSIFARCLVKSPHIPREGHSTSLPDMGVHFLTKRAMKPMIECTCAMGSARE